uniref:Craniofacial development protein 2-like n=1 Tax=Nicotiana tabacum TaxID=4097 RepID=A0A1S3YGG9_TOBAC|nr:PREDICTED: uncharacterized protein LOC107775775 [Nicotiana tabacum]
MDCGSEEGEDFSGHIGSSSSSYSEVHNGFGFGEKNRGGTLLLDFVKAFELAIANSRFPKKEDHLHTFQSTVAKTQIDYLLFKRYDRGLCKDYKIVPSDTLVTHIGIMIRRKKSYVLGRPRFMWSALTKDKARELEVVQGKLKAKKAAYLKLVGNTGEEERRANNESYKVARKEAKLELMEAKTVTFPRLYKELGDKRREEEVILVG